MNWKFYGVTYTPLQRIYDAQTEGREHWLARMRRAAREKRLHLADGTLIERIGADDELHLGELDIASASEYSNDEVSVDGDAA